MNVELNDKFEILNEQKADQRATTKKKISFNVTRERKKSHGFHFPFFLLPEKRVLEY